MGTPPEESDDDLLQRSAHGDSAAFAEFFRRYQHRLGAYFYRRTFCPETTADLTSETFARAIAGVRKFNRRKGTGGAWLFGIANNVNREWVRKGVVRRRTADRLRIHARPLAGADLERVEELADVEVWRRALADALDLLTPGVRDAVLMRVALDLPYGVVAEKLGCSEAAARVRVTRGLAKLSASLETA
jgi:RNA polymerase sigma factor (sigma-70 family)